MLIDVQSIINILEKIDKKYKGKVNSDQNSKILTKEIIDNMKDKQIKMQKFVKVILNSYFDYDDKIWKSIKKDFLNQVKDFQLTNPQEQKNNEFVTVCQIKENINKTKINQNVFSLQTSLYSQKSTEKRDIKQKNQTLEKRVVSKGSLPKNISKAQQNNIFVNMGSQQSLRKRLDNKKQVYPTQNFIVNFFDFCQKPKRFDISSSVQRYYQSYQSRPISKKNQNHKSYKKLNSQQKNIEKYSFQDIFSKQEIFQSQADNKQQHLQPLVSLRTPKRKKKKSLKIDTKKNKNKTEQKNIVKERMTKKDNKFSKEIIQPKSKLFQGNNINKIIKLTNPKSVYTKPQKIQKKKKSKQIQNQKKKSNNLVKSNIKPSKNQTKQRKNSDVQEIEKPQSQDSSEVKELSPSSFVNGNQDNVKGIDFINHQNESENSQDSMLLIGNLSPIDSKSEIIIPQDIQQINVKKSPSQKIMYKPLQDYENHKVKQEFEGKDYKISFGTFIKNAKEVLQTRQSQHDFKKLIKNMINHLNSAGIINKLDNQINKASFVKENFDFKIVQMSVLVNEIKHIFKIWTEISTTKIKLLLKKSDMSKDKQYLQIVFVQIQIHNLKIYHKIFIRGFVLSFRIFFLKT